MSFTSTEPQISLRFHTATVSTRCDELDMFPLRVLIIDDSPDFIQAATFFLEQIHEIAYVVGVIDTQTALKELNKVRPHLVLVDFSMPGMNGLETTRMIKTEWVSMRVVILSVEDAEEYRRAAAEAGADAYIPKSEFAAEFMPTVRRLFGGNPRNE